MSAMASMPSVANRGGVGVRGNYSMKHAGKIGNTAGATPTPMGRRNQLRAQLRAKSARPTRLARGGVMPVEAKHSAVPEAQVRVCGEKRPPKFSRGIASPKT
jgi:hypothetical protein